MLKGLDKPYNIQYRNVVRYYYDRTLLLFCFSKAERLTEAFYSSNQVKSLILILEI